MFRALLRQTPRVSFAVRFSSTSPISVEKIRELRNLTGSGINDCKKALTETNGDIEEAKSWLRKKGILKSAARSDRQASMGLIVVAARGKNRAAIVEVNSETDFVARNKRFQGLASAISLAALNLPSASASVNLLAQASINLEGSTASIKDQLDVMAQVVGEKLDLRRVRVLETSGFDRALAHYVHGAPEGFEPVISGESVVSLGSLGVVLSVKADEAASAQLPVVARKIAMHVAAASPQFIEYAVRLSYSSLCFSTDRIDPQARKAEEEVALAQAQESKKPENIIKQIVQGRISKWEKEVALLEQIYVLDSSGKTSVKQFIKQELPSLSVEDMLRWRLGGQ